MSGVDRSPAHLHCILFKVALDLIFHHQSLDSLGTGYALVKVAGDGGVDLPDLSVEDNELALKIHH